MANRFVLNTISYHGSGAIKEIPGELQRRGYKKIFVCSDPDLTKFFEPSNTLMCNFTAFVRTAKALHINHEVDR